MTESAIETGQDTRKPAPTNGRPRKSTHVAVSRPVLIKEVTLNTLEAKRVFRRTFGYAAINLYAIDVLTNVMLGLEEHRKAATTVDEWMTTVRSHLAKEDERVAVLFEQLDVRETVAYTHPEMFTAEISTPLATRYLNMIVQLDELIQRVHVLCLTDAVDNLGTQVRTYEWQQQLIKLAGRIRSFANGLRGEIRRARAARHAGAETEAEDLSEVAELLDLPVEQSAGELAQETVQSATA
jgi:hypothetical protein